MYVASVSVFQLLKGILRRPGLGLGDGFLYVVIL